MTRKGWLLFIAMSVFWGIPYLFIKIALRELDPAVVVFARVGIAAAVLAPCGDPPQGVATAPWEVARDCRACLRADLGSVPADQLRRAAHYILAHQLAHRLRPTPGRAVCAPL